MTHRETQIIEHGMRRFNHVDFHLLNFDLQLKEFLNNTDIKCPHSTESTGTIKDQLVIFKSSCFLFIYCLNTSEFHFFLVHSVNGNEIIGMDNLLLLCICELMYSCNV